MKGIGAGKLKEKEKIALLSIAASNKALGIYNINQAEKEVGGRKESLTEIMKILEDHCVPTINGMYQRYKFGMQTQMKGGSNGRVCHRPESKQSVP